jgi:hypothetical protein
MVRILAHHHHTGSEEVNEWPVDDRGRYEVMVVDGIEYNRYDAAVYARLMFQPINEMEQWDQAKAFIYLADDEIDEETWLREGWIKRKNKDEYEEAVYSLQKENTRIRVLEAERLILK